MKMNKRYLGWKIAGCIVLGVGVFFAIGYGVMYLWNWLIPSLFNGPVITFWQAWGLFILSKILFGFGGGGGGGHEKKRRWKEKMKAKMQHMSPEERERVRDQFENCMGGRWGWNAPKEELPKDLPNETKEQV